MDAREVDREMVSRSLIFVDENVLNFVALGPSQNNFNRRSGQQQDIPSLLSQPMPLMDNDGKPSRQRNNGKEISKKLDH